MSVVVRRVGALFRTADRLPAYAQAGGVACVVFAVTGLQWTLFEPRTPEGLAGPALQLVVVLGTLYGVLVADAARSEPQIHRPFVASLALLGVSVTTTLLGEFLVQAALFTTVFEDAAFVLALAGFVVASRRWATYHEEREATLERRNERLDEFASVASHDLRNPIQVASGNLDLVREENDEEALERLACAIERMDDIVDDVLQFSRIGAEHVDPEPIDLETAAEAAWDSIQTDAATMIPEGTRLNADPQMLQQALENFFRNAIDHGDDDVFIWVGPTSNGFYVMDDGPGISGENRDQIFDSGYSGGEHGTGFGLAIVERIVEAHDWSIQVVTGHDAGARFEIRTE